MNHFIQNLRRRETAPGKRRATRPVLEGLEERIVLFTTNGGVWTYPIRITYSFVPDGTNLGGVSSNMFATLNAVESQSAWQQAIEQAAAIWEQSANLNLAYVSDNGAPEGTAGNQQDDSRFGDIRIGMANMGPGFLAYTEDPPPINGGTDAGDITFNSYYNWAPQGGYDLETVALHEFGHALGLGESTVAGAVMYGYYNGVDISPSSDDLAGIQSLYGAPAAPYGSNKTLNTAYNLSSMINSQGQLTLANQSLQGATDKAVWYVTVPSNTNGTMFVSMETVTLSSLTPRITIFNSAQQAIAVNSETNVFGGFASIQINGVSPGQGYYIEVAAASSPGAVGAYGLLANFGPYSQPPILPPNTVVVSAPDEGGGGGNEDYDHNYTMTDDLTSLVDTLNEQIANGTFVASSWADIESIQVFSTFMGQGLGSENALLNQLLITLGLPRSRSRSTPSHQASNVVDITGTALNLAAAAPPLTVTMYSDQGSS